MVGTNTIKLNVATVNEAIQFYFDTLFEYEISVSYTSWKTDKIVVFADGDGFGGKFEMYLNSDFLVLCLEEYLKKKVLASTGFDVVSVEFAGSYADYYEVTIKEIGDDEDTV